MTSERRDRVYTGPEEQLAGLKSADAEMRADDSSSDVHEAAAVQADGKEALETHPVRNDEKAAHMDSVGSTSDHVINRFDSATHLSTWRFVVLMLCICSGLFVSLMDTAIVSTALYTISADFGDFDISSWAILSYTLAYVGFGVMVTRLSDVFGRKWLLLSCFAVFSASSLACAWSSNMIQLIVFRGIQGVGGAGLYSLAMVVFPEIAGLGRISAVSSIVGAVLAVSGVCGPVLGGVFTTEATWRWCFWINGPCGIIPMVVIYFVWPKDLRPGPAVKPRLVNLDYIGAALFTAGSVLLIFILNTAAVGSYAWESATVIVVFIVSGLCWIALFVWEWYILWGSRFSYFVPHFPFRLVQDRVMACAILNTFCTGFILLLLVVNIPLRAVIVNSSTAIQSGIRLLPMVGGSAFGSFLSGVISSKKNNTFISLIIGSCLMLIGASLLSTLPNTPGTSDKQWGFEAILGLGLGISLASATMATVLQAQRQDHAIAQGIVAQIRILGGSIGIAIASVVTSNHVKKLLQPIITPAQLAAFNIYPGNMYAWPTEQQAVVRTVYSDSFEQNMKICAGVAAACLLVTVGTWQKNPPSLKRGPPRKPAADGHQNV